jgi:S-formylglutathione hydrolase FrmB
MCCGTEDELLEDNRALHRHLLESSLEHDYAEQPGAHDWAYWDAAIRDVLDWLPLERRNAALEPGSKAAGRQSPSRVG